MFATDSEPAVVEKLTSALGSTLPLISKTLAVIVDAPPVAGIVAGSALRFTWPTAAVPTAILREPVEPTLDPPDSALIVAVPFDVPALNVATARPLTSVDAVAGCIEPSVVVKVTSVPECGAVPDGSITCAMICVVPLIGNAVAPATSVIDEPLGA